MTDIHIPPEAVRALAQELGWVQHETLYIAAIRAALAAWPGVTGVHASPISPAVLILPLNTENPDAEA